MKDSPQNTSSEVSKEIYIKPRRSNQREQDHATSHASLSPTYVHSPSLLLLYNTLGGLEELLGTVETWVSMMSPALSSLPGLESCKHPQPLFTNTNGDPKETNTDISGGHQ